ncbi:MAG: trehalose-6-phosphate synthase, partial [Micromonosporaceae bacterium]
MTSRSSFVVVANRLPVDASTTPDGQLAWKRSPGGLVTALHPIMQAEGGTWIGWPGNTDARAPSPFELDGMQLHPIPVSAEELEQYYEGFSNASLWPLYHDSVQLPVFHRHWWDAYVRVNRRFAEATAEVSAEGAAVWVQD